MIAPPFDYTFFDEERPSALVVSHERSGTHFLMNALANCYGYVAQPWLNFDYPETNINYFWPEAVSEYLLSLTNRPMANLVKSHHAADFFSSELTRLTERYVILSICRHPVSVMVSYWRYLHGLEWLEGPKVADPLALARSEPWGAMRRYHIGEHPTVFRRWAANVEGWIEAAEAHRGVVVIRYEDLDLRFERTMRALEPLLGRAPQAIIRPQRGVNTVSGGSDDPKYAAAPNVQALEQFCREEAGATMARLGY